MLFFTNLFLYLNTWSFFVWDQLVTLQLAPAGSHADGCVSEHSFHFTELWWKRKKGFGNRLNCLWTSSCCRLTWWGHVAASVSCFTSSHDCRRVRSLSGCSLSVRPRGWGSRVERPEAGFSRVQKCHQTCHLNILQLKMSSETLETRCTSEIPSKSQLQHQNQTQTQTKNVKMMDRVSSAGGISRWQLIKTCLEGSSGFTTDLFK